MVEGVVRRHRRAPYLFQIGALRFGFHGMVGIACTILTEVCRRYSYNNSQLQSQPQQQHQNHDLSRWWFSYLLWLSQLTNFALATHAATLLSQVPPQTAILSWIVAPHREAFRRTMGMMQYLVVRIICQWSVVQFNISKPLSLYGTLACLAIPYVTRLVPGRKFWATLNNGNTWIFVLPIWLGTTGDLMAFALWDDVIRQDQLLQVQLVGLGLAFGFTLAFRRYIPMPVVYFMAAWHVWKILCEGYATIVLTNTSIIR